MSVGREPVSLPMKSAAEQYQCLLENRRPRRPLGLDEPTPRRRRCRAGGRELLSPVAGILRGAARQLKLRERAVRAWSEVADPVWLAETTVDGIDGQTLVVLVGNTTLGYELRRRAPALGRAMSSLVSGIHGVRFVVAGCGAPGPDGTE